MRVLPPLIDYPSPRPNGQPRTGDLVPYRRPGWFWLGCVAFGIACWIGVGFGIHELVTVL